MTQVTEHLSRIRDRITAAALEFGREPDQIRLLAVSKRQPIEKVRAAIAAGQRDFGENIVQEAIPKIETIPVESVCWHFIGHLQTNKTRQVASHFSWVHTVDRPKIAQRLSAQRPDQLPPLNVCLQVNTHGEETKNGADPTDVPELAKLVDRLPGLRLRGLMCLPPQETEFEQQRDNFRPLRELFDSLKADGLALDVLSMGMTDDMRAAIAEGATIVRVGTGVFGPRV